MNRITLNTLFQIFARSLEFVSGLLINTWLARQWGSQYFGKIGLVSSLVGICSFLFSFGVEVLLIRTIARDREKARHYLLNGFCLIALLASFGASILIGAGIWLLSPAYFPVLALASLQLLLSTACLLIQSAFYAFERMEFESIASCFDRACWLGLGAWLAAHPPSLIGLFSGLCLCKGIKFLLAGGLFIRYILPFTEPATLQKREQWGLLKQAIPFGLDLLFSTIYVSADVILLAHWVGDAEAGYYRAAAMLIVPFTILAASFNNALFPGMSVSARSNPEELRRYSAFSSRMVLLAAIPISLFVLLFADSIISLLYGKAYAPTVFLLRLLSLVIPLRFLNNSLSTTLLACDRQADQMKSEGIGSAINLLSNALLLMRWHAVGACFSVLLTDFLRLFILWGYQRKAIGRTGSCFSSAFGGFSLSVAILFPLAWLHVPLFASAAVLGLAYPLLLLSRGGLTPPPGVACLALVQSDENL